jgi:hypothetical protein
MQISYDFHKKLVNLHNRFGPNEDLAIKSYGVALIFVCIPPLRKQRIKHWLYHTKD